MTNPSRSLRKTRIIATLGPSSSSVSEIEALIASGMDIARINLSHGNRDSHAELIRNIRTARENSGTYTAILFDTRGPEVRVVDMPEGLMLIEGRPFCINGRTEEYSTERIGVNYPGIAGDVKPGDRILLDDGKLVLKVEKVQGDDLCTRVMVGGLLTGRKRVSLPGIDLDLPSLAPEDIDDILFGIQQDVDFVAASFIRRKKDVDTIRRLIEEHGGHQDIISKIENRQGVENLEEILDASDGLMVARGDLGVELHAEEVPIIQKRIIEAANSMGKPVITATQMLESMVSSPSPTRAEASDVTNAVMDGSDAVMLSAETATGKYPLEAVSFLARCTVIAESALDYKLLLSDGLRRYRPVIPDAIAYASCAIAGDLDAAAIISVTASGSTARRVAMYRPASQIIAVSSEEMPIRKLQILRGVTSVLCEEGRNMDEQIVNGVRAALDAGLIREHDIVAIIAGCPLHNNRGTTNLLRVHKVGEGTLLPENMQ